MAESTAVAQSQVKEVKKGSPLNFFNDVAREMRKVSWPKREELQDATVITLVLCVLMSAFTFGVDKIFETAIRGLFRLL